MELPNKFVILMTDDQFLELVNFKSFSSFKTIENFKTWSKEYQMHKLSPFYSKGGKVFYLFNSKFNSFNTSIILPGGRMDPKDTEIIDYSHLIRDLKLEELLGND